jgi:hypothetical protein
MYKTLMVQQIGVVRGRIMWFGFISGIRISNNTFIKYFYKSALTSIIAQNSQNKSKRRLEEVTPPSRYKWRNHCTELTNAFPGPWH